MYLLKPFPLISDNSEHILVNLSHKTHNTILIYDAYINICENEL